MADNEKLVKTENTAVSKPADKPQKPKKHLWKRFIKYMRDTKSELKKIIWPTFQTVVRNTTVTLVVCAILGVLICGIDIGLSALIDLVLTLG